MRLFLFGSSFVYLLRSSRGPVPVVAPLGLWHFSDTLLWSLGFCHVLGFSVFTALFHSFSALCCWSFSKRHKLNKNGCACPPPPEAGGERSVWGEEADSPGSFTWCPPYMSASTSARDCDKEPQRQRWVATVLSPSHQLSAVFAWLWPFFEQQGPCPRSCPSRRRTEYCRGNWRGWRTCWHTAEPTETSSPSSTVQSVRG